LSIFQQLDAFKMDSSNEFDLISSNGLNIYESDDKKVTKLYQNFYQALKPGGKLVTSFLTPPPGRDQVCDWDFDYINQEDLMLQKAIFADILQAKWQCFRTEEQTRLQLEEGAGFNNIKFKYDQARMFPTVIAIK